MTFITSVAPRLIISGGMHPGLAMVDIFKASWHVITGFFQFSFGAGLPWLQRSVLEIPEMK